MGTEIEASRDYKKTINEINNEYVPVKIKSSAPAGNVYEYEDERIIARAVFHIQNYSDQEQSISFLLYQHNYITNEDQLFNLEHVYICLVDGTEIEIENGVIKIPGGETMMLCVEGVPRDQSKVMTSRSAPEVEIVKLD